MRTFQEFILLVEKYYEPNEKLPSGKTPREKAKAKAYGPVSISKTGRRQLTRQHIQRRRTHWEVARGADSPEVDNKPHPDLEIDSYQGNHDIYNKKTGIKYRTTKKDDVNGKPTHLVSWSHTHPNIHNASDKTRQVIATNAKKMWKDHIENRLPSHSLARNSPQHNNSTYRDESGGLRTKFKNTRGKLYQRMGFGKIDPTHRNQHAKVGRPLSPKQAAKGKKRLTPLNYVEYDD